MRSGRTPQLRVPSAASSDQPAEHPYLRNMRHRGGGYGHASKLRGPLVFGKCSPPLRAPAISGAVVGCKLTGSRLAFVVWTRSLTKRNCLSSVVDAFGAFLLGTAGIILLQNAWVCIGWFVNRGTFSSEACQEFFREAKSCLRWICDPQGVVGCGEVGQLCRWLGSDQTQNGSIGSPILALGA